MSLTGPHFPSSLYHSSQNVSLTTQEEREWQILKEISHRDLKENIKAIIFQLKRNKFKNTYK